MSQWIDTSVKNQTIGAKNHHRNSACAARFSNSRMGRTVALHAHNDNRGAK